jgi:hypothetical protein
MTSRQIEMFSEMLESLPVKAVIHAAAVQRRMVQTDLEMKRTSVNKESLSILGFCTFLIDAAQGIQSVIPAWPIEHCAFYRHVVQKLVEAGELPPRVKEQFDFTFSRALFQALSSPD